jgi:hypothetical protein
MSTDRDTTRIVRSWLRTDEHDSADRVLDAVLDALDTTPQRRATWWPARRFLEMNNNAKLALAAAAVMVVALVGAALVARPNVGSDGPAPSGDPPNTPSATAASFFGAPVGSIDSGVYVVDAPFPTRVSFTLPEGWEKVAGGTDVVIACGGSSPSGWCLGLWIVANVAEDPCDPSTAPANPRIGPTVDDLAASLAANPAFDSTAPTRVTVSGFEGVHLELAAPEADSSCTPEPLLHFTRGADERSLLAGERTELWIIDVDGERLVIDASRDREGETSAQDLAELQAIVDSIQIEP